MDYRCKECFSKNYDKLLERFPLSEVHSLEFSDFFHKLLNDDSGKTSPEVQRELHHKLLSYNGIHDPWLNEKQISNQIALELYREWKPKVIISADPFDLALRLAIAGNIMDYGANHEFNVHETIEKALKSEFGIDHSALLRQRISEAKSILYLGDNAGEIVFDKLFIETINHPRVIYAVKDAPAINDVTFRDAKDVGMQEVAVVISNGYDAPSTILDKCSPEFMKIYRSADLIISKGQGNLEGLINENDPRIFFLFMVKCDVISEHVHAKKGSLVILYHTKENGEN